MTDAVQIASRLTQVREAIAEAARRAGREPDSIRLIAVSKLQPVACAAAALAAGQLDLGENYAQELRDKAAALPGMGARWHMIGALQRNKVKYVVGVAEWVHTLDSLGLAEEINRRALAQGIRQRCLVQVNVGAETQKNGCAASELAGLIEQVAVLPGIDLQGLMCIPPAEEPEATRPFFRRLVELAVQERARSGLALAELSMGMSADFTVAIEEGSTMVRVGTAIFGARV